MLLYEEFCLRANLQHSVLEAWIAAGWILPNTEASERRFSEADLARAALIRDLHDDLGINDDGIAVVLDLLDQIHGLRRSLRDLSMALTALPADARARIQDELRALKQE